MPATVIDPEKVISRYRADLEAARHQNLLLEIHTSDLQSRVAELEAENDQLTKKVQGMARQMGSSEGSPPEDAGDTAE